MEDINEKSLKRERGNSTDSSDSQHTQSSSSDVDVESAKFSEILVTRKILKQKTHLVVKFIINSEQRPDTLLPGDDQGDHTTSYIAIIGSMLAAVDDIGIRAAVKAMSDFGEQIFKNEKDTLNAIRELVEPEVHERGQRKLLKDTLNKQATSPPAPKISKTDEVKADALTTKTQPLKIEQILHELKYAKVSLLADYLCELSTVILSGLQKQSLTAFFSKGRIGKDSAEGAKTKSATRALLALNMFCKLLNVKDKADQKLVARIIKSLQPKRRDSSDTEEDHVVRYGSNALVKKLSSDKASTISGLLKEVDALKPTETMPTADLQNHLSKILQIVESNPNIVAEFINDLFDYQHELQFKEIPQETLKKYFDKDNHRFVVDDTKKIISVRRTNTEELVKVLNRHLLFIALAFPELHAYLNKSNLSSSSTSVSIGESKSAYERVRESFLSLVLETQGWKDQEYEDSPSVFIKIDSHYLLTHMSAVKTTLSTSKTVPDDKHADDFVDDTATKLKK